MKNFFILILILINQSVFPQTSDNNSIGEMESISLYKDILISSSSKSSIPPILVKKSDKYYNNLLLLKSLCEFKNASYWNGYWDLKKAYNSSLRIYKNDNKDVLNGLILSIISATIKVIPQEYQWIMKLIGFSPIKEYDTTILIEDAKLSQNELVRFEAYTAELLIDVYLNQKNYNKKIQKYESLYSNSFEGKLILSWIYDKLKYYKLNISNLTSFTQNQSKAYDYYYYLLGSAYFYTNQYEKAELNLTKFTSISKSDYLKTSKYELFLINWMIKNKNSVYLDSLKQEIINKGTNNLYLDRHAESFALKKHLPNKDLMLARIFFDSKQFIKSDSLMIEIDINTIPLKDKLEYNYRYARVKQALNDTTLAIKYYLNVIDYGGTKPKEYFTANSALNLGKLYQGLGNNQKASFFYKKAYSYPKHTYKNSIDSEAKRRLNSL